MAPVSAGCRTGGPIFDQTPCKIDWKLVPAPGGFDIEMAVRNPTGRPQKRPAFLLRGVRLGTKFTYLDGRSLGHWHDVEKGKGKRIFWYGRTYPDDLYCPLVLLHNERFAIGMSLIYDVPDARHEVRGVMYSEGGRWFGTAGLGFDLHVDPRQEKPGQGSVHAETAGRSGG